MSTVVAAADPTVDPVALLGRAALVAGTTLLLGVGGHLALTGSPPGPAAVVGLLALVLVVALAVLRVPAGVLRMTGLLVGGQGVVQLGLLLSGAHAAGSVGSPGSRVASGALALPVSAGRRVGSLQDSHDVATGHTDLAGLTVTHLVDELPHHTPLVAAHLVVAVALGLALALGEGCLWTLVALRTAVALALSRPTAPVVRARPAARTDVRRRPRPLLLLSRCLVRRGPPALLAAT